MGRDPRTSEPNAFYSSTALLVSQRRTLAFSSKQNLLQRATTSPAQPRDRVMQDVMPELSRARAQSARR